MKKLMAVAAALFLGVGAGRAMTVVYDSPLVYETVVQNGTYELNLDNAKIDYLSFHTTHSSATIAAQTFGTGTQSTATITVTSNTGIANSTAAVKITISSMTDVQGSTISIGGATFTEGLQWKYTAASASTTACALATAFATYTNYLSTCAAGSSSGIIWSTAPAFGAAYNVPVYASSPAFTIENDGFTGGRDNATVKIGTTTLTFGVDMAVGATAALSATNLAAELNLHYAGVFVSTANAGSAVVRSTYVAVGTAGNVAITVSTQAALTISGTVSTNTAGGAVGAFSAGRDASWTINTPTITIATHGFTSGLPVLYTTSTNPTLGGLVNGTTYYIGVISANAIKLASSQANVTAGTYINITSSQSVQTAKTYTLTPSAFTQGAGCSAKWQASNDGSNWFDLSVTSMTFTPSGTTSVALDMGLVNYKKVRLNVLGPTWGGVVLHVYGHGKNTK